MMRDDERQGSAESDPFGAGDPAPLSSDGQEAWEAAWPRCRSRVRRWRIPPQYSPSEWHEEVEAEARLAAVQAEADFDPDRGVPLAAYMYLRLMGRAIARYRREWSEGLRRSVAASVEFGCTSIESDSSIAMRLDLSGAMERLSAFERKLLGRLFWLGESGSEVARSLGVSQQAVSKRKAAALERLRQHLGGYA